MRKRVLSLSERLRNPHVLEHLRELTTSRSHSLYLKRHRASVIMGRVRVVAAAFAALTALWIGVDALTFSLTVWTPLLTLRLLSCGIFALLALPWPFQPNPRVAATALLVLLINPLIFYVAAQYLFHGLTGPDAPTLVLLVAALYDFLPFITLAGLSIFPLTAIESLGIGLLVFASTLLGHGVGGTFTAEAIIPAAWTMMLVTGVYVLSGVIQVHYMIALVNRLNLDPLTQTFTRRSGTEVLDLYFHIAMSHDQPFAVAFADLDDFKSINDIHGHEAGDTALRQAADEMRGVLRRGDLLVRWGGEEFLLVLPATDAAGAELALGRILDHGLGARPDGAPLTASFGLAERMRDGVEDWRELLAVCDKRMYEAKRLGKNRCVAFDGNVLTAAPARGRAAEPAPSPA